MAHLLVDGYNLLYALQKNVITDLEDARNVLLERLHDYQTAKNVDITVVFDSHIGSLGGNRDRYGGLHIVYTDRETTADEWIKDACKTQEDGYVVVTNDREIILVAESLGCLCLSCGEFEAKLTSATFVEENPYFEDKENSGPLYPKISTKKKGVAKRLPKKDRRKAHQLRNL
jgi:predicted RNA-binding protein with PIN domain